MPGSLPKKPLLALLTLDCLEKSWILKALKIVFGVEAFARIPGDSPERLEKPRGSTLVSYSKGFLSALWGVDLQFASLVYA